MSDLKLHLKQYFNYDDFRDGQEEIVKSIMNLNHTFVVMPTGGGKSLCYQLPAIMLDGTAIVISPLIALMKDQVDSLLKRKISATMINSSLSNEELKSRLNAAANGEYKLIYVAPERLESKLFIDLLKNIKISFVAVDEAHCISEWGHDFRPSYLQIADSLKAIPNLPIIALTATATPDVQDDIVNSLGIPDCSRFIRGFDRSNLRYQCEKTDKKIERIVEIIKESKSGSIIIYCGSRKRVEFFAEALRDFKFKIEPYHAGMNSLVRTAVQDRFIKDKTRIIVATNAFGMGIDKPDVRHVIHVDLPASLEAYYQEAGRAGRDGKNSYCYLLYHPTDTQLQEFFINSTYPNNESIEKVYNYIYDSNGVQKGEILAGKHILNPVLISNETGINAKIVVAVLNLFEKFGVIKRNKISTSGKIKFTSSKDRIIEYYNNVNDEKREVLEAILRSLPPEVFHNEVALNIVEMKQKHYLSDYAVESTLKAMEFSGLIEFENPNSELSFEFPLKRVFWYKLPIDYKKVDKRREFAFKKLNHVLQYAETKDCKRNYILKYFSENDFTGTCGHCTSCKSQKKMTTLEASKQEFVKNHIMLAVNEYHNKFTENAVVDYILGIRTNYLKRLGAERGKYYGVCKGLQKADVVFEVSKLITEKKIERNFNNNKVLVIPEPEPTEESGTTPQAFRYMERADTTTVFNKLVVLRRDIAERAGVVPRGIISDVSLRKIAETMPDTEVQLRRISGISQVFVQKFSKLFLTEISKLKNAPKEQKLSKVAQDTLKLINQGLNFEQLSKRLFSNRAMAASYIQEVVESGYRVDRKRFVDDDVFQKVKEFVVAHPEINWRESQGDIDVDLDLPMLKMVAAFVKRELFDESTA